MYSNAPDAGPSWHGSTGFVQRHQPAFWLFVITLVITGLDFLAQQLNLISMGTGAWLTTIVLLVPYAIPVFAIIYYLDLYEREPLSIMVAAVLWGGIAATALSMYTNTPLSEILYKVTGDVNFVQEWSAALTAPFVEEGFKLLGVVLLISIARDELDDELDGFVWGAMVGMGFLLVEDTFYFMREFASSGDFGSLILMFMVRIVGAGPYSHFLYTGLTGMGVAYYLTRTDKPAGNRMLVMLALVAAGVGAHFFWNSPLLGSIAGDSIVGFYLMVTVKGLPMLIGLVLMIRLARRRARVWFASFTQTFADDGAVTAQDQAELSGLRARRRARKAAGAAKGPMGEKIKGELQKQQIALGMLMSKHRDEAAPEVAAQQAIVLGLKSQLDALPSRGFAAPAAGAGAWAGAGAPGAAQPAWGQPAPQQAAQPAWGQPAQQAQPSGWGQPVQGQPAQPAAQPVQPAQPAQPAAQPPAAWGQPTQPAASAQPAQPAWGQPVQAAAEPVQAQPAQPAEPAPAAAQPAQPAQPVAQPVVEPAQGAAQPQPVVQPVQPAPVPAPAPAAPAWTPTHDVPDGGMPAWANPDPSQPPVANLAAGLDVSVAETRGDWARVVAVNGWTGWVDNRRLIPKG